MLENSISQLCSISYKEKQNHKTLSINWLKSVTEANSHNSVQPLFQSSHRWPKIIDISSIACNFQCPYDWSSYKNLCLMFRLPTSESLLSAVKLLLSRVFGVLVGFLQWLFVQLDSFLFSGLSTVWNLHKMDFSIWFLIMTDLMPILYIVFNQIYSNAKGLEPKNKATQNKMQMAHGLWKRNLIQKTHNYYTTRW